MAYLPQVPRQKRGTARQSSKRSYTQMNEASTEVKAPIPLREQEDCVLCTQNRHQFGLLSDIVMHAFGSSKSDWTGDALLVDLVPGEFMRLYTGSMVTGFDVSRLSSGVFSNAIQRIKGVAPTSPLTKLHVCFDLRVLREEFNVIQSIERFTTVSLQFKAEALEICLRNQTQELYRVSIDLVDTTIHMDTIQIMQTFSNESHSHCATLDVAETNRWLKYTQAMRKSKMKDIKYAFVFEAWGTAQSAVTVECARIGSRRTGRYAIKTSSAGPLPAPLMEFCAQSRQCSRTLLFCPQLSLSIYMNAVEPCFASFVFQSSDQLVQITYLVALADMAI